MRSRIQTGCVLAVLLLCAMAHPAFADGALGAYETLGRIMIAGMVILGVIVGGIVVLLVVRARRSRTVDRNSNVAMPRARVVKDPLKPS